MYKLAIIENVAAPWSDIPDSSIDLIILSQGSFPDAQTSVVETQSSEIVQSKSQRLPEDVRTSLAYFHSVHHDTTLEKRLLQFALLLLESRRVLKDSGSIYLHCDGDASPFVRILCARFFGSENVRSEITWRFIANSARPPARNKWPRQSARIIYCTISEESKLTSLHHPVTDQQSRQYRHVEQGTGRKYRLDSLRGGAWLPPTHDYEFMGYRMKWRFSEGKMSDLAADGRIEQPSEDASPRLKRYLDEAKGPPIGDIWNDCPIQAYSQRHKGDRRFPAELYSRMILASSNEGDTVLNVGSDSANALIVAHRLGRNWIGVSDQAEAIPLLTFDLAAQFGIDEVEKVNFTPDLSDGSNSINWTTTFPKLLENWTLSKLFAEPIVKEGEDFDGIIYLSAIPPSDRSLSLLVRIYPDTVTSDDVDTLLQDFKEKGGVGAVGVTAKPFNLKVGEQANKAGAFKASCGSMHPRIQLVTFQEMLDGKSLDLPVERQFSPRPKK